MPKPTSSNTSRVTARSMRPACGGAAGLLPAAAAAAGSCCCAVPAARLCAAPCVRLPPWRAGEPPASAAPAALCCCTACAGGSELGLDWLGAAKNCRSPDSAAALSSPRRFLQSGVARGEIRGQSSLARPAAALAAACCSQNTAGRHTSHANSQASHTAPTAAACIHHPACSAGSTRLYTPYWTGRAWEAAAGRGRAPACATTKRAMQG